MKILLTGGAGYIGTHTCVELINSGFSVIIADNFSNSNPDAIVRVQELTNSQIPIYPIDVSNYQDLDNLFYSNKIDAVIHFAASKAVGESVAIPLTYYRNNIDTTLTLLEVMDKHHVNKIVFSSSASVYGIPENVPLTETMPTGCTNPYGWTKLMIEQILTDVSLANQDLSVVMLRYFNPIGAHKSGCIGEDPKGIPNNLLPYISQVAVGKLGKLCVFGNDYPTKDGTGIRDYIHVVDLAKGHVAAINYMDKHTAGTEIFNLGTGTGYSVLDIVKTFEKVNGVSVPFEIFSRRSGDIAECYADASKAAKVLKWKTEKTLDDMCRDTWRWQNNNPDGY